MKQHNIGLGIAFAVGLGIAAPSFAQQAVQWRVEDGGNGHWYQRRSSFLATWDECRSIAESIGGHLVTITTSQEQAVVASLVAESGGNHWIGGFESDLHDWRWVTSEPWMFENGMYDDCAGGGACIPCDGENRQDYLVIEPSGMWNDSNNPGVPACACCPDTNWLGAIVEWSADCNADGIVDYGQILRSQLADTDSNGVPDICEVDPCPGDVVESGSVNGIDLAAILANWGTDGGKFPRSDANGDGTVDANDLAIVLSGWGNCP